MYFSDTFKSLGVFIGMHVKSSRGKKWSKFVDQDMVICSRALHGPDLTTRPAAHRPDVTRVWTKHLT